MLRLGLNRGCALRNYRLYRFDGAGKIVGAEWLAAADDDDAARQARESRPGAMLEVWDRGRLVVRIVPERSPPTD